MGLIVIAIPTVGNMRSLSTTTAVLTCRLFPRETGPSPGRRSLARAETIPVLRIPLHIVPTTIRLQQWGYCHKNSQ